MTTKNKASVFVIGIAGASGSGKSFFAEKIFSHVKQQGAILLSQDYYYKDLSHLHPRERENVNYDHPDAIDFPLLIKDIRKLKAYQAIEHPLYDFTVHNRKKETVRTGPAHIVLLDGILIYAIEELRSLIDFKIYVDTPLDICFIRRLQRDTTVRGRSVESVISQYLQTVRPMFLKFVQPTKKLADFVVVGEGSMEAGLRYVLNRIPKR